MNVNEKIKARRIELQLAETEVARKAGLSIHEYCDIEQKADELSTITELYQVSKICLSLNFDFFDLFDMRCDFCDEKRKWVQDYMLPRNELVKKRRKELNLTPDEIADELGFDTEAIHETETYPNFLEIWRLDDIKTLSNILDIPLQVLFGAKCSKCGR